MDGWINLKESGDMMKAIKLTVAGRSISFSPHIAGGGHVAD